MTKSQLLAAVAGCLLIISLAVFHAPAQHPGAPARGYQRPGLAVALLDLSRIFKEHTRFKAMMAEMRSDAQGAQAAVDQERQTIQRLNEQLQELKPGTVQYKQLEQEIATRTADLNVRVQLQRKEFMLREAKIWHTVYKEVQREVNYYAINNGIAMVLRFNAEPVQEDNLEDVVRDMNQQVIWSAQGMDITDIILQSLNRRALNTTDQRHGVPLNPRR